MKKLTLFGATGRMGRAVTRALVDVTDLSLCAATASAASSDLGQAVVHGTSGRDIVFTADPIQAVLDADVAIDFSHVAAVAANLGACVQRRIPVVIAVTGIDTSLRGSIANAAQHIAVLVAANTSLGVALMARLVALAAGTLPQGFDVEISEAHHRMKRDAPSGTALALGHAVSAARGTHFDEVAVYARHGHSAARVPGTIGFSSVRAGDIVGVHTVLFAGQDECLEITHRATDRLCFARGALKAAAWLSGRPPGLYRMEDVLELNVGLT